MMKRMMALLLAVIIVASCLPAGVQADNVAHIHCECGKEKTLAATCASCGTVAVEWTPTDTIPTTSNHYYLTKGVTAKGVEIKNNAQVSICLHGKDITSTDGGQILAVSGGATLSITDCSDNQGKITGATSYAYGSALRVKKGGTFKLYGGKIAGNNAPANGDGTVYVDKGDATTNGGAFYMYGGEISGNTARRGAGIFTVNAGTSKPASVYILGGVITGNEAKGTGSTYGGGGILSFCPVVVGGNARITGNKAANGPADIYLRNSGTFAGKLVISAEMPLTDGAKINVGSDTEATDDPNNITCITGSPANWNGEWLTYAGQNVGYTNGKFVGGHFHGNQLYTPVSTNAELANASGCVYLTTNLNLGGPQTRNKNLNLCLNGHNITAKAGKRVFTSAKNAGVTVAIEDCSAYTDSSGVYHAGMLTGGSDTGDNGGGAMYVAAGNTLHLYDGIITGNSATTHGGALTVLGTLHIHGGRITGNTSKTGGAIFAATGAKVYIDGDPYIYGNGENQTESNLYLSGSDLLTVGTLESTAKVGVSVEVADRAITEPCGDYSKEIVSDIPAEYTISHKNGALFMAVPITHIHCICGSTTCTSHESVGFAQWKKTDSLPGSGNYCLMEDVTLTKAVPVTGELNLCLHGHTITQTGAERVFKLDVGPLNITDCSQNGQIIGGTNDYGAAVVVMEGTTFNLYGGKITGSKPATADKAVTGAAIFLRSSNAAGTTFNMYGGEISGNGNAMTWGGAVTNGSGNEKNAVYVNIYGGKITGNTAGNGGAIRLENKGELTIAGGEISGNTATGSGGAVYLSNGFLLKLQGGKITGNTAALGGGIYPHSDAGSVTVSGNPVVTDNTVEGKQNNLYLGGEQTITLGEMADGAKVGVTAPKAGRAISTQTDKDCSKYFVSDSASCEMIYKDKALYLDVNSDHYHCVCAAAVSACDHSRQKWIPWDSTNTLPTTSGYYYLTADVQLTATNKLSADQQVFLCLNGKTVKAAKDAGHYILARGAQLSITDCNKKAGGFTGGSKAYGGFANVVAGSVMNLYAGEIYGNAAPGAEAGAIYLQAGALRDGEQVPGGVFNLYGGKIHSNTAGVGGAIRAAGVTEGGTIGSQVNIYGGEISGNKAVCKLSGEEKIQGTGGAIAAIYTSQINIYGGTISGNTAEDAGGGIYLNNKATLNLKGGKIANNMAQGHGGGIFATAPETAVTMDGGEISGNQGTAGAGVMLQTRSVFTMNGGKVAGNKATSGGGGFYVSTNTDLVVNGGEITGNETQASGGAIYALRSRVKLQGGTLSNNTAVNRGGAFVAGGAEIVIGKCTISGNSAKEGGAAYINRSSAKKADGTYDYYPSTLTINDGALITGNKAETNCGGLLVANDGVIATMNGGQISKNTAASGGAVMTWTGATFVQKGGQITGNTSTGSGGALYISTNSDFLMEGGEISGNTAGGNGGAVYALASNVTVTGGTIKGNTATSAGALFMLRANGEFKGGTVSGNTAKAKTVVSGGVQKTTGGTAGAMYVSGSVVNVRGTSFTGNRAGVNGGAVVLGRSTYTKDGVKQYSDAKMNIYSGTFSGNIAEKVGGCMLIQSQGTVVNMYGGTIRGNTAKTSAGGVYASTNTTFNMTGGAIVANTSEAAGGGMYVLRAKVTITGGQLNSNIAKSSGAQMVVGGDTAEVVLKNLKIHSGTAKIAGGIVVQSNANFTAENCDFYDNSTTTSSGAVYISTRTTGNFINCKFYNNTTTGFGGAFTAANFAKANIKGCDFTQNTAKTLGGAIYANPVSIVTIEDSTISNCSAGTKGGAIGCKGSIFLRNSVIENCSAPEEGGAVYAESNTAGGSGLQRGIVVEGSQIRNNTSNSKGGAFYILKTCRLELYDSQITGNSALSEGGAIWTTKDLELHNTEITGNTSGGEGFAVYTNDAKYDGHSFMASVNKLSGSTVIKDNKGGDLWMAPDVVFAISGNGLGEKAYINLTLDSGVVTNRILGAYHYEGGDRVYTVTYGDRSMTDPEMIPGAQTEQDSDSAAGDVLLYVVVGVVALAVVAVVVVLLLRKKKTTAKEPAGE